ncbi:hypothetical protein [Sphingobium nicotianae]|uniref:Uncharacterized protein n=1 Tax=Sphingobium nicotianae TaxID=2782607 RepID=A0A9X1D9P8_9SPHN|nr:hypothetical protein [Sphingobium nicotianae]MBT2185947.1 hypothetical protein [Sphingobium nicotianae]
MRRLLDNRLDKLDGRSKRTGREGRALAHGLLDNRLDKLDGRSKRTGREAAMALT